MAADRRLLYADASALVKFIVTESESAALKGWVPADSILATTELALVEVHRAVVISDPDPEDIAATEGLLRSCSLVAVSDEVLADARTITSQSVRTLDAIHLASARRISATTLVTYDKRMIQAGRDLGMDVVHPGLDL